jgi:hypothetical protein
MNLTPHKDIWPILIFDVVDNQVIYLVGPVIIVSFRKYSICLFLDGAIVFYKENKASACRGFPRTVHSRSHAQRRLFPSVEEPSDSSMGHSPTSP